MKKLQIKKPVIPSQARKSAHGSGQFSKSEIDAGYKTCYTAMDLHEMDVDRLHNVEEFTMAHRRNGTTSAGEGGRMAKKNLRRSESKY